MTSSVYDSGGYVGYSSDYPVIPIITNGLVFNFDAKDTISYPRTGTAIYDIAGNLAAGELVNSPTFDNSGFFTFNGSTNYARFPTSTALNNQTFSVEVWVKTNATTQNGFWFEKGQVNTQYALFQESTSIKCRINNGSGLVDTISPTTATYMNTTSWYQVVFTFTSGSQVCYINTAVAGTGTTAATVATSTDGVSLGVYGGYTGGRGYYYNGSLAITRVYNRVLSAAEVAQNFNSNRKRFLV